MLHVCYIYITYVVHFFMGSHKLLYLYTLLWYSRSCKWINIVNYITTDDFINFLKGIVENNIIKRGADFFMRTRTIKDFRFGIGREVAENTYQMPDDYTITGEAGCINRFYQESEMIELLKKELNLQEYKIFHLDCQNLQNGVTLLNSDIVIWGKVL